MPAHLPGSRSLSAPTAAHGDVPVVAATTLHDEDPYATNTADDPDRVVPRDRADVTLEAGRLTMALPAISFSTIALARA